MLNKDAVRITSIAVHTETEPLTIGISQGIFRPLLEIDQQEANILLTKEEAVQLKLQLDMFITGQYDYKLEKP